MIDKHERNGVTLKGLLMASIGTLVLVLLAGSFYLGVERFRSYLSQQLQVHAQDAATALGLSLSTAVDGRDQVASASVIDAVFDRGDYRFISYRDVQGESLVTRQSDGRVTGVPGWFVRWAALPLPQGEAEVVQGWHRLGVVQVASNPNAAYQDLWRSARDQMGWFLLIGLLALGLAHLAVSRLLRPLNILEQQARAVQQRDFSARSPEPYTRELRGVTQAMNQMADDLGELFAHQVGLIEKLRQQSSIDPVTGLSNRSAFDQRLRTELESEERGGSGVLLLVQLESFADYNQREGRESGDVLLLALAECLSLWLASCSGAFSGRRSGAEFAAFLPGMTSADARHSVADLLMLLEEASHQRGLEGQATVCAGLAVWHDGIGLGALLSHADMALRQSQAAGVSGFHCHDNSSPVVMGAEQWRRLLEHALETERLHLLYQPMYAADGRRIVHWLIQSRLELDSEWVTAAVFIPLIERFAMAARLDQLVLSRVLRLLEINPGLKLSVSLAASTLSDPGFLENLPKQLAAFSDSASRLWLSVPEQSVRQHVDAMQQLITVSHDAGVRIAVDRFGVGGVQFGYLHQLPVDAIRLDRSYIRDIERHADNRFFVQSILPIAHGRGMYVHACGVETAAEWDALQAAGVDGAMGYHLCRPIDEVPPAN